jgi:hypothetical protein
MYRECELGLTQVDVRIKIIIIIVLNLTQGLPQVTDGGSSWVELSQHMCKSSYYHSLKTRVEIRLRVRLDS